MIIGFFGATVIASVIVKPIRLLENHVKKISEIQDKEQLDGYEIEIKSRDEIRILGDSINEMTRGLVKAAKDEKIAMEKEKMELDGKAVQQTFIPLNPNREGRKETTAALDEKDVQFFGYYEGADAVSGDYFDYRKLDDRWYAVIKCDVSGHGVPAALIMTAVATQFRKYFETWSFGKEGIRLNELVTSINDFIESLGVKGKFATLMVCLFDTKTGDVYMCNAGDNIIHIFDSAERVQKKITLHEAPAAGPLPSFMVEMKGGFKVEKVTLKKDDVLFLYTDGIEEATRFFRDSKFEVTSCSEPGLTEGEIHENHKVGQQSEQMEPERVKDIVESLFNRVPYRLEKFHCPEPEEELIFDFSKCDGSIDECILALASVEKIFRIYKKNGAAGTVYRSESGDVIRQGDTVRVDRKIDEFLAKTFSQYNKYCSQKIDAGESNYIYYTGVNEDPQADDLTLLALRKK
ncbi:MAG: SpoIIE family protein phosphatase [Treponema sp.]|nr:SpoIIE family protein phosphatase [Treponema sp.]